MAIQTFQIGVKGLVRNDEGQILMVHLPDWNGNPAHWDLPGGRIDDNESFLDTLRRELIEEISVPYVGTPKQLMAFRAKVTIPVGKTRLPLALVIYEVKLPENSEIKLDPESAEDQFEWFSPSEAADKMSIKFAPEFCELVRNLN